MLIDPTLTIVDELVFGSQVTDGSYGRFPNGTGIFTTLYPTHNGENSLTMGLIEPAINSNMVVFPNPASETISIVFNTDFIPERVYLYNIMGDLLFVIEPVNCINLDLSNLSSGLYFIRTSYGTVKKLIIQ